MKSTDRRNSIVRNAMMILLLGTISSCHECFGGTHPITGPTPSPAVVRWGLHPPDHTPYRARMAEFLGPTGLDWKNWDVYEYNDTQKLYDGAGGYGPITSLFANPNLAGMTVPDYQAASGIIAVVVYVSPGSEALPSTYTELGLQDDFTCVVMNQNPVNGAWSAYAVKSTSRTCVTDGPRTALEVAVQSPYNDPDSYPPVARFQETEDGRVMFGVRCLAGWCEIKKQDAHPSARAQHIGDAGERVSRKSRIPGWHDDQSLAVRESSTSNKLVPRMRASIIPEDSIAIWDSTAYQVAEGKLVATIFIRGPVEGNYRQKGLRTGWNELWLRKDSLIPDGGWTARFKSRAGDTKPGPWMITLRTDHHRAADPSFRVPSTARWAWYDLDEEIWVECDVGCCRVQSGGS